MAAIRRTNLPRRRAAPRVHDLGGMRVLVIDIGGTHVKLAIAAGEVRRFDSGPELTPVALIQQIQALIPDWEFDAVSVGYPGAVGPDGPVEEAGNIGPGWVGFDFEGEFHRPVRVINDAALQALGSYDGGRMLFLGLGTGLGSALVAERVVIRLELGSLEFRASGTIADRLGTDGLAETGETAWRDTAVHVIDMLGKALSADYVVLGGGNASRLDRLPERTRLAGPDAAFIGGTRLWEQQVEHHDGPPSPTWRILR